MSRLATTHDEIPVYITAGDEDLFGVLTMPTTEANDIAVIALSGGGWMPSTHRNRMWVRLARGLAASGYHVLRIDYHGVGESTGTVPFFELNRPAVVDLTAAAQWLRDRGLKRLVLVGTCFGGRTALATANSLPGVEGVVLSATPVEDYLGSSRSVWWHIRQVFTKRVLLRLRSRYRKYLRMATLRLRRAVTSPYRMVAPTEDRVPLVSDLYLKELTTLLERGVPVLIMHGDLDNHHIAFTAGLQGQLGRTLDAAGDLATVVTLSGELHGELSLRAQDFVIDEVESWLASLYSGLEQRSAEG